MTWKLTGSLTPRPDGSYAIDVEASLIRVSRAKAPAVSAVSNDDVEAEISNARREIGKDLEMLAGEMVELLAGSNATGKVAVSRTLREIYRPLVSALETYDPKALAYGMQEAVARGKPNVNYAKKAAASYSSSSPVVAPSPGHTTSRYTIVTGEGHE